MSLYIKLICELLTWYSFTFIKCEHLFKRDEEFLMWYLLKFSKFWNLLLFNASIWLNKFAVLSSDSQTQSFLTQGKIFQIKPLCCQMTIYLSQGSNDLCGWLIWISADIVLISSRRNSEIKGDIFLFVLLFWLQFLIIMYLSSKSWIMSTYRRIS